MTDMQFFLNILFLIHIINNNYIIYK